MKFLAIMKDSFREAIDTTVFTVLLVLATLFILFVASVSYRPVTVEDDLKQMTSFFNALTNWAASQQGPDVKPPHMDYSDFRQLNPGVEPWKGDYAFTFTLELPEGMPQGGGRRRGPFATRDVKEMLQQQFGYLDNLEVKDVSGEDAKQLRFEVTSRGTKIDNLRGWKHEPVFLFGLTSASFLRMPLGVMVYIIEDILVNTIGSTVAVLVGVIVTAFFIPNMLRKGTVDLLLVKPMNRVTLLLFKYLGGLTFMFLTTAYVVVALYLVLGLRTGIWTHTFLLSIFVLTFFFALLYSLSTLCAVLTRSPIVSILLTCLTWGVLIFFFYIVYPAIDVSRAVPKAPPGANPAAGLPVDGENGQPAFETTQLLPDWVYTTFDGLHTALPRTRDVMQLNSEMIQKEIAPDTKPTPARQGPRQKQRTLSWSESLGVSSIYIVVCLVLSCLWFARKDY